MDYIGHGIYTYKEASHLTGISNNTLRRWIEGYSVKKSQSKIPPVFSGDYNKIDSTQILSFLDIIEVLFIKSFHGYGIGLQTIRIAIRQASKLLDSRHPFAMRKFYTDGHTILAKIVQNTNSVDLLDLIKKQYQLVDIVLPTLYECIDFNNYDIAEKWWPLGKDFGIVVDPERNFGKPIIDDINIGTQLIMDLYSSGHSKEDIVDWYDIDLKYVNMALQFEKRLAA